VNNLIYISFSTRLASSLSFIITTGTIPTFPTVVHAAKPLDRIFVMFYLLYWYLGVYVAFEFYFRLARKRHRFPGCLCLWTLRHSHANSSPWPASSSSEVPSEIPPEVVHLFTGLLLVLRRLGAGVVWDCRRCLAPSLSRVLSGFLFVRAPMPRATAAAAAPTSPPFRRLSRALWLQVCVTQSPQLPFGLEVVQRPDREGSRNIS